MIAKIFSFLERNGPKGLKNLIPEKWRIWVGYQIKIRMGSQPTGFDLRQPLPLPAGSSRQDIFDYLLKLRAEGRTDETEIERYLDEACDRYLYTLSLVPEKKGKLLDIGASPYHLTMLVKKFRDYEIELINYFGETVPREHRDTVTDQSGTVTQLPFTNMNVEAEPLPYPDNSFDVVMICEVLEHFTNDPAKVISEIKRVLNDDGICILSTPNVARLENICRLIAGENIYDPYSGYGPYGRHNREYTQAELQQLFEEMGFSVESLFTSDVHQNQADFYYGTQQLGSVLNQRQGDLGQYIFVKAANRPGAASSLKPRWLYRSYAAEEMG